MVIFLMNIKTYTVCRIQFIGRYLKYWKFLSNIFLGLLSWFRNTQSNLCYYMACIHRNNNTTRMDKLDIQLLAI
jgi:hypothetical protein